MPQVDAYHDDENENKYGCDYNTDMELDITRVMRAIRDEVEYVKKTLVWGKISR